MDYFAQLVANGLHNSMLYAVLAYGYVLAHEVTRRPNLAHGAVFAFSGQVLILAAHFGYLALVMTFTEAVLFGAVAAVALSLILLFIISRLLVPQLMRNSRNAVIVITLAFAIVLMELVRLGADTRDLWLPPILPEKVLLLPFGSGAFVTKLQLINIVLLGLMLAAAHYVLTRTRAGQTLRAVADDPLASALQGVDVQRVTSQAVFAGGLLAAAGGMLAVLYIGNMSFGAGLTYGLKVLFIAAAGGFTTPLRAAGAAFLFGEAEMLWDGYFAVAWREPIFYAGLAAMLCLKGEQRSTVP